MEINISQPPGVNLPKTQKLTAGFQAGFVPGEIKPGQAFPETKKRMCETHSCLGPELVWTHKANGSPTSHLKHDTSLALHAAGMKHTTFIGLFHWG